MNETFQQTLLQYQRDSRLSFIQPEVLDGVVLVLQPENAERYETTRYYQATAEGDVRLSPNEYWKRKNAGESGLKEPTKGNAFKHYWTIKEAKSLKDVQTQLTQAKATFKNRIAFKKEAGVLVPRAGWSERRWQEFVGKIITPGETSADDALYKSFIEGLKLQERVVEERGELEQAAVAQIERLREQRQQAGLTPPQKGVLTKARKAFEKKLEVIREAGELGKVLYVNREGVLRAVKRSTAELWASQSL